MPENTLLSLLTGGRYGTSADLPTIPETAHSFMDDLIANQDSQMPQVLFPAGKNIFGQPTKQFTRGDLESLMMGIVIPGQGASALTKGSPAWLKTMKDLKLDAAMTPKMREWFRKAQVEAAASKGAVEGTFPASKEVIKQAERELKVIRDLRGTQYSPKYKDAPRRAIADYEDLIAKFHTSRRPTAKSKMAAEYRHTIDKNLLKAMEEIERTGMSGTIHQGTEANIKNTFRALMDLIK